MLNPSYLTLSSQGIYHFRWPLPKHLLGNGKRRYCKVSLKTREPLEALRLSRLLASRAVQLAAWDGLRGMDFIEIKKMVQTYFQRLLQLEKEKLEALGPNHGNVQQNYLAARAILGNQSDIKTFSTTTFEHGDHADRTRNMFASLGVAVEPGSVEWNQAERLIAASLIPHAREYVRIVDEVTGEIDLSLDNASPFTDKPEYYDGWKVPAPKTIHATARSGYTLGEVTESYVRAHSTDGAWDENTRESKQAIMNILLELLGADCDIAAIDLKQARALRDDIKQIPKNRNKNPKVRDLSLRQAMQLPEVERITGVTVSKYFNTIRSLFDWCVNEGYVERNPFATLKISADKKRKKSDRSAFSHEHIRLIIEALNPEGIHYRYWGTLLGIYSGARLNEICQLELDDIQQQDGIWYFNMNDEGDTKRLKTAAAKRFVPIHNKLLESGIIAERDRLKKLGHDRFLHELRFHKKGYGKKLGHYFNEVLMPQLGLKTQAHKEVFHALRHTAVTRLYQAGVPQPIVESIVGHERAGTSQQVYFQEGYKLSQLKEAMDKYDPLAA